MEAASADQHTKGMKYLKAAKRLTAIARSLGDSDEEAIHLRRTADRLTDAGLAMILKGARELQALVRRSSEQG